MIKLKTSNYSLEDGSVLIIVEDTIHRLHRSLLERLSPGFLTDICQDTRFPEDFVADGSAPLSCFSIRPELKITRIYFDALVAHIVHDITLFDDDVPFSHILRLYVVSSERKCGFRKIFRLAERRLNAYLQGNPLDIDLSDYRLLEDALEVSSKGDNAQLRTLLRRALYYSYATHDGITFSGDDPAGSSAQDGQPEAIETSKPESDSKSKHITGSEAAICERFMSQLSENFSPTLFQPPAALHMQCTDVYAGLWMDQAVQPAFGDNGMANPFWTLKRLRSLEWKREAGSGGSEGERTQPCNECFEYMRQRWSNEAQSIWEEMDSWLVE